MLVYRIVVAKQSPHSATTWKWVFGSGVLTSTGQTNCTMSNVNSRFRRVFILYHSQNLEKQTGKRHTMCFKTKSRPTWGGRAGIKGRPFSKKSMGDFTGSNFEGAHHLEAKSQIRCEKNLVAPTKLFQTQNKFNVYKRLVIFVQKNIPPYKKKKQKKFLSKRRKKKIELN